LQGRVKYLSLFYFIPKKTCKKNKKNKEGRKATRGAMQMQCNTQVGNLSETNAAAG